MLAKSTTNNINIMGGVNKCVLPRVTTLFGKALWTIDIKLKFNLNHLNESNVDC